MLASKQGFLPAQYNVGVVYGTGEGVIINKKEAFQWYKKASLKNDADAIAKL